MASYQRTFPRGGEVVAAEHRVAITARRREKLAHRPSRLRADGIGLQDPRTSPAQGGILPMQGKVLEKFWPEFASPPFRQRARAACGRSI